MTVRIVAVGRDDVPPLAMSDRFRHEITYFMSVPGEQGVPKLPEAEYWVKLSAARQWYDDGAISIVSPLDGENRTEMELSEEQEVWLEWMLRHQVEHVRVARD